MRRIELNTMLRIHRPVEHQQRHNPKFPVRALYFYYILFYYSSCSSIQSHIERISYFRILTRACQKKNCFGDEEKNEFLQRKYICIRF